MLFVLAALLPPPAHAQSPTVPPSIDVTCHGYDEGATRAYNCIPVASQQRLLGTFVPPVGSACNGGKVAEFPPGRIVFQIRCDDNGGGAPPTVDVDYEIVNVRRYLSTIHIADWVEFLWRARKPARRFEVTVRFQQGAFFTTCTEYFYNPTAGAQEDDLSIPDVCGADQQWTTVTIQPADGKVCQGCGTFQRASLPRSSSLVPGAADPIDVTSVVEEFELRTQMGATRSR